MALCQSILHSKLTCSDAYSPANDPGGQQGDAAAKARDALHGAHAQRLWSRL